MRYYFQLGREPNISFHEITAALSSRHISFIREKQTPDGVIFSISVPFDPDVFMPILGGTVLIGEYMGTVKDRVNDLATLIDTVQLGGKIQFSLADERLGLQVKKELKSRGRSVRYVKPTNTAALLHNNLVEKQGHVTLIGNDAFITRAIQPIEAFSERDFGRPGRDAKSGMLPPKLARMMINLSGVAPNKETTLLDPFCGSGTVLMEAMLLEFGSVIGSDLSEKAVDDSKKNVVWLQQQYNSITVKQPGKKTDTLLYGYTGMDIFHIDATKLHTKLKSSSVDVIVTEPSLGKPLNGREKKIMLDQQAQELKELYVNAFASFQKILKKNGVVVFLIPRFQWGKEWVRIDCKKDIEQLGFSVEPFDDKNEYLLYRRPDQLVGREVWRFRKTELIEKNRT